MNGNKLKKLREKQGLLQKQLGDKLGISASTIGMYEQGRREPDNDTLKKIATYFNVSTDYLLDNEKELSNIEKELKEKETLKKVLIKNGFMKNSEDLTDVELEKLMKFINSNKDFIKGIK